MSVISLDKNKCRKAFLDAGYCLPCTPMPCGNYAPAKTVGKLVYLTGVWL
jgi:hypothetical protein